MPVRDLNMAMIAISASLVAAGCGPRNHDVSVHAGAAIAPCGRFAVNGPLGEPPSVLDRRMTMRALVGAAVAPPALDFKGQPTLEGAETRISHDVGEDAFVIVASEVYANAKPSFDVAARHFAAGPALMRFGQITTEPLVLEGGARAIGLAPARLEWNPGPVFVYGLLVDVGDLLLGRFAGRRAADVTLFESLGIAIEGLAAAHYIYAQALAQGAGVSMPLGPDPEPNS